MKTHACIAILAGAANACSAFVPALVSRAPSSFSAARSGASRASRRRSSPEGAADDAVPSDVSTFSSSSSSSSPVAASVGETPAPAGLSLANELLQTIYSGVGDGYMPYSEVDKSAIEELVVELESSGQDTDVQFPRDLGKLDGRWRLVFTNNLTGLGKLSPIALRDVYQVVDASAGMVNNVVYATMSPPLFSETWGRLGGRVADLAKTVEDRITFPVDFNIQHNFEVSSQSKPAQIELVQKELKLMNAEDAAKRSIALPALQPLAKAAAGRFDTTFLDDDVRISRGRFGELRVFQREA
ncbi:unnamed protein product [Hapterophycus canaliculatus]